MKPQKYEMRQFQETTTKVAESFGGNNGGLLDGQ